MKMMQQGDAPLTGVCFFPPSDEEKSSRQPRETRVIIHRRSQQEREFRSVCAEFGYAAKKKKKNVFFFFFFPPNFFLKQNPFYTWVEIIFGSGEQIITLRLIYVLCSIPTLSESGLD